MRTRTRMRRTRRTRSDQRDPKSELDLLRRGLKHQLDLRANKYCSFEPQSKTQTSRIDFKEEKLKCIYTKQIQYKYCSFETQSKTQTYLCKRNKSCDTSKRIYVITYMYICVNTNTDKIRTQIQMQILLV